MIDIILDEGITAPEEMQALICRAAETAIAHMGRRGGMAVLLTTEEEIQRLNREFRNVDRVTDVLSFPSCEGDGTAEMDASLGDIAICVKRAEEQAELYGHPLEREMAFLTVHGSLHLMGYDHMEPEDEQEMRALQREIMERMGLTVHE